MARAHLTNLDEAEVARVRVAPGQQDARSASRSAGNRKAVGSASGKASGPEVGGGARELLGTQEILPPRDELHRPLDREIGRDT